MTRQDYQKLANVLVRQGYRYTTALTPIREEDGYFYKACEGYSIWILVYDLGRHETLKIPGNARYAATPYIIYGDMDGQRIDLAVTADVCPEMISKFEGFAQQFHDFLQSQKKDKLHNEPKNYIERLQHEIAELNERIARLETFMADSSYKELPHKKQILLEHQYDVMHEYHDCLTARLELETASPE